MQNSGLGCTAKDAVLSAQHPWPRSLALRNLGARLRLPCPLTVRCAVLDGGIEEPATPSPVVSDAPAHSLTDEQLNEIISLCFNEVLADPEITNVIAAMPEEWAQSTYDMAQNQYCETVVVNVEEWRKMSRFDD